jgi:hypothetical protein
VRPGRPRKDSITPTLAGLGITRQQSSDWQRLAALSVEDHAALREKIIKSGGRVSVRAELARLEGRPPAPTLEPCPMCGGTGRKPSPTGTVSR